MKRIHPSCSTVLEELQSGALSNATFPGRLTLNCAAAYITTPMVGTIQWIDDLTVQANRKIPIDAAAEAKKPGTCRPACFLGLPCRASKGEARR